MDPNGANPTRLTNNLDSDDEAAWLPADGAAIAFESRRGHDCTSQSGDCNFDLWSMRQDGATPGQLTNDPTDDLHPSYSPDGSKIAYWAQPQDSLMAVKNGRLVIFTPSQVMIIPAGGEAIGAPTPLLPPDQKEGFCLIDGSRVPPSIPIAGTPATSPFWTFDPNTFCDKHDPTASDIDEGLSVGWTDTYAPRRGGQDVVVTGVPAGRYYLVRHVNMNGAIQELNADNDVATATVDLTWPSGPNAMPKVVVLKTCFASATCPYTDPLPPPPPSPPAADVMAPKLLLGGATRQRFLRGRSIYVYAKCDEACTISASGRIAALQVARSLATATTKLSLKPGMRTMIKLRISKRVRATINRQLARGARVTVRVTLVATNAAGNKTSGTRRLLTLLHR
jgi:hypothetical protein